MAQHSIGNACCHLIGAGHQIDRGQAQQIANFRRHMIHIRRQFQLQSLKVRAVGNEGLQAVIQQVRRKGHALDFRVVCRQIRLIHTESLASFDAPPQLWTDFLP